MIFKHLRTVSLVLWFCGVLGGCADDPSPYRTYTETNLAATEVAVSPALGDTPLQQILIDRAAAELQWTVPSDWTEQATTGIRFASFRSKVSTAELVVVGFPGDVGTLPANVERWLGQMNAQVTTPRLQNYLGSVRAETNAQGLPYVKVDLTEFAASASSTAIITVILKFRDQSVFLKMQDEHRTLIREQDNFNAFIASLRW